MPASFHASFRKALAAVLLFIGLWCTQAQAGVTITPNTLIIEGRERYADVTLINTADTPNTYEMGWKFFQQEEDTGRYINLDKPTTDFDLSQNSVFTPRRMTLMPNKAQKIRLALRLKGEPPAPGDYRGHFELREVTPETPQVQPKDKASVGVTIKVGFTIPVIYRVGESDARATIGTVRTQVNKKTGKIETVIPLTKSKSPYGILGNLRIYHSSSDDAIGSVQNANIFPEITGRTFTVPLRVNELKGGTLRIVYEDRDPEKKHVYAEKTIPIGQ